MNGFVFFVNGRLAPPGFFSANVANTATRGMVAYATVVSEKMREPPKTLDIFEIRSGNIVRQYHSAMVEGTVSRLPAEDGIPERVRFQCHRVANTI